MGGAGKVQFDGLAGGKKLNFPGYFNRIIKSSGYRSTLLVAAILSTRRIQRSPCIFALSDVATRLDPELVVCLAVATARSAVSCDEGNLETRSG